MCSPRYLRLTLPVAVVLALAGLAARPAAAQQTVTVHITNFDFTDGSGNHFDPVVFVGDTVEWVWDAGIHSSTSAAGQDESWDSGNQSAPGGLFDYTFSVPGTYAYYCDIHGVDNGDGTVSGMSGMVTVMDSSSRPELALMRALSMASIALPIPRLDLSDFVPGSRRPASTVPCCAGGHDPSKRALPRK